MMTRTKIFFILILLLMIFGAFYYLKFFRFKVAAPLETKVIDYETGQESQFLPEDLYLERIGFQTLSNKETRFYLENKNFRNQPPYPLPDFIVIEKKLKWLQSFNATFDYLKNYLKTNNWNIISELQDNPFSSKIVAKREGYLYLQFTPSENRSTIVYLKFEYHPKNPLREEPKQVLQKLPPAFPSYLVPKNSKIGGYLETSEVYNVLIFSDENIESLRNFYLKTLENNNWKIILKKFDESLSSIIAENENILKNIKINISPSTKDLRSIIIELNK